MCTVENKNMTCAITAQDEDNRYNNVPKQNGLAISNFHVYGDELPYLKMYLQNYNPKQV